MKKCIICGLESYSPIKEFFWHIRPLDFEEIKTAHKYVKGNIQICGSVTEGLISILRLCSPLLSLILGWKNRKLHLVIPEDADVCIRRK